MSSLRCCPLVFKPVRIVPSSAYVLRNVGPVYPSVPMYQRGLHETDFLEI